MPSFVSYMNATEQERKLVAACLAQEKGAWDSFVEAYSPFLYATVRKLLTRFEGSPDPERVDALFSDVFYEIFRNECRALRSFTGRSKLSTYIYVIVFRRLTASFKNREREGDGAEMLEDRPWGGAAPLSRAIQEERAAIVRKALANLPDNFRQALELFYFKGFAYAEIARALNVPENHVGMILKRGREKVERILRLQKDSLL